MNFIVGNSIFPKKAVPHSSPADSISRYRKLVEVESDSKMTWPEIAVQIKEMKPIAKGVSSAELIRSIREEF